MVRFTSDPAFLAVHGRPAPLHFVAKTGKDVHFKVAGGANAHGFYVPPARKAHSAVILVHEFWGLNDYIRREAERLNSRIGAAVLAIDLYDGKVTTDAATASKYMQSVDPERCLAIAAGALSALKSGTFHFKPRTIGTVGYCFGGGWSERTAIVGGKNVQACVIYYGLPDITQPSLAKLKAPVLMFQGKKDAWINDKVVSDFQAAMKTAGKSLEVHAYDANHAFANPSNPRYDAAAAKDAMRREIAFFKAHL
ncbi:MAG: dienelactone hydrolase family protein [Fimbriimonadaceae bacterium]